MDNGPPADPPIIRIVWGTGTGETPIVSYDAALTAAGIADYNLSTVSSIIPAGVSVESTGTAPDLGRVGTRLTVVEARETIEGPGQTTAGLGWALSDGPGLFYECAGIFDERECRDRIKQGLDACRAHRDWVFTGDDVRTVSLTTEEDSFVTALVLAVYGDGTPIL